MKKILCLFIALVITLSILAGPIVSISNNSSSNKTKQEIKDLVAQSLGVISLESLEQHEYIFIAVAEEGWIIVEIDGDVYLVPIEED